MANYLWKMLMEAAAVGNDDELGPATNPKDGEVPAERRLQECQLTLVAFRLDADGLEVRLASVH